MTSKKSQVNQVSKKSQEKKPVRTPKYSVDMEKLREALKKETPVSQIAKDMGFPNEAKPYLFNAIKRLKATKVSPGVYKLTE
jgi:hypothetical protein